MKRLLIVILAVALFMVVAGPVVLWVGSYASLDHDMTHTKETQALERFNLPGGEWPQPRLSLIEAGGNIFRARTAGFGGDRGNVILLHGFPETSAMYEPMMAELARAGFRVIAFDQRGYSPGIRPSDTAAYTIDNLSADVFAVADAVGFDYFHLVGHDWGAVVGWSMVLEGSPRIKSWSSLSIPHMGAYATAILNDPDQQERSAYVGLFQMPWLPEAILSFNGFAVMRNAIYSQHGGATLDEYLKVFSEPGALTAALNWYRALNVSNSAVNMQVSTPTAYIWGNEDPVVGEESLKSQREFFDGNLWETELNTGHWLMETEADAVTAAVLEHITRGL